MTDRVLHPRPEVAVDLGGVQAGEAVVVRGVTRTSFDGASFDATTTTTDQGTRPGGLYQLEGVGLRVAEQHVDRHEAKLIATGEDAPLCRAAGLSAPCLLPRTKEIAHERLLTETELASTLTGSIEVTVPTPPPPPLVSAGTSRALGGALVAVLLLVAGLLIWRARAARRATLLGRVQIAAAEARAGTAGDPTLAAIRAEIDGLVGRAEGLEAARVACARRLAHIDPSALARKRAAWAASASPGAQEASQWMAAEEAEAGKLARDHASAVAGLEQIAAALRVVALRSRQEHGVRVAEAVRVALDDVAAELTLREQAMAELDADVPARPQGSVKPG